MLSWACNEHDCEDKEVMSVTRAGTQEGSARQDVICMLMLHVLTKHPSKEKGEEGGEGKEGENWVRGRGGGERMVRGRRGRHR